MIDDEAPEEDKRDEDDRDLLTEAKEAFELAVEAEQKNRDHAKEDLRFARLGEQWPEQIKQEREQDNRPCLTINRLPAFIRQVVNDARQNKPAIKVHPADSNADVQTAEIINGLIRNIEYTSDADIAYDTATESAVSGGWGYLKIDIDYAHDDTFDLDIKIKRVADPFSIYGDPHSKTADSSDWMNAFEIEWLTEDAFKAQFPDAEPASGWDGVEQRSSWVRDNECLVANWWQREEISREVIILSNGAILDQEAFLEQEEALFLSGISVKDIRETKTWKVTRHIMTGAEILKSEAWPGKYIPIIPVYGDEVWDDEGNRHLRSLIRDAKDSQRNYNYWRTTATEMIALAPRVPFIGPKGAFKSDARRWATANSHNHPYLEYDIDPRNPMAIPTRQPLDTGPAAGALQEAMNASDDIKAILGLHDASLGAQGNETSGKAILARQREGDVSTFHFQDNMARAIRHAGRILIDLIPHIYNSERIVRVIGEDGTPQTQPIMQPVPVPGPDGQPQMQPVMGPDGQPQQGPDGTAIMQALTRIYDLAAGKYDLTVTTGPSYTTKREEAAVQMVEMSRAFPQLLQVSGDLIAKNLDWPGADEIAKRLKAMLPPQISGGLPPEVQAQIEQGKAMIGQMQQRIKELEDGRDLKMANLEVDRFKAETERLKVTSGVERPNTNSHGPVPRPDLEELRVVAEADKDRSAADRDRAQTRLTEVKILKEVGAAMPQAPDPFTEQIFDPRPLNQGPFS